MRQLTLAMMAIALTTTGCARGPAAMEMAEPTEAAAAPAAAHPGHEAASGALTPELRHEVARVRTATARYQRLETAKSEGWTDQHPAGCASSPDGAQAFHYLNPSLVDGQVDLLKPELFMYEPQADGSMELIGVDYIIPFDQWQGKDAPRLIGQPMMRNEPLGVWAIHIWAWRDNPSGMFAPWNPDVSCEHAR